MSKATDGARARRARRMERRGRHLRALAEAASETVVNMHASGVDRVGELGGEASPFERVAREVLAEHQEGRLTDADLLSLGIRDSDDGLWIRIGPRWGAG